MSTCRTASPTNATHIVGSDRYPFTVVEVVNAKTIRLQVDNAKRAGTAVDYEYSPNPDAAVITVTLRKSGRWVMRGKSIGGTWFIVGARRMYLDPHF
jgi:hypothetical protein